MKVTPRLALLPLAIMAITTHVHAADYDVVIKSGHVIDPETGLSDVRNLGINDGTIVKVTTENISGKRTIDAEGQYVTPGFIDLHHHGQNISGYRMQGVQGVTTALELESGILPIADWYEGQAKKNLPINYGASAAWTFARVAAFTGEAPYADLEYFQKQQGRSDWKQDIASPEQMDQILAMVEEGINEGAIGIGINAGYAPGYGQKEYYALAKLAAKHDVGTFTHVRYASMMEPGSSFEAIKELIANATLTGARMHINHINSTSLRDIDATLELVNEALEKDVPISVGAYPWGAASTVVGAAMFSGDHWKERMGYQEYSIQMGLNRLDDKQLVEAQKEQPGSIVNWHFLDESKQDELAALDKSILHPAVTIESDSMPWMLITDKGIENYEGDAWPLPENAFSHPRSSGSFTKILETYVRDRGVMSIEEAIFKVSYAPATILQDYVPQMMKKGRIQEGADADIVIFDLDKVETRADYQKPAATPLGINNVMVNGELIVENGELIIGSAPGQPIRRDVKK
ncbi:amidohydrolase family protein [Vibrio astriarenae]